MYFRLRKIYSEINERVNAYLENLCSKEYTVILFGSRARGDHRPDSDWDILVIGNSEPDKPLLPINLFYYKPSTLTEEIKKFNTIVIDAFYEGKLLCDNQGIYDKLHNLVLEEIRKRKAVKKRDGWYLRKDPSQSPHKVI